MFDGLTNRLGSLIISLLSRNPGVPTIEEELLQGLVKAQAIPESMADDLNKVISTASTETLAAVQELWKAVD